MLLYSAYGIRVVVALLMQEGFRMVKAIHVVRADG